MVVVGLPLTLTTSSSAQPGTGSIRGTVRFTGAVPPPKKIPLTDGVLLLHHDLLVEEKSKGLRYVAAILENAPAGPRATKAPTVVVDQRDMVFQPRVVAVQHGQPVRFENNDLCNHSVMATSIEAANQFHVIAGPNQPKTLSLVAQKRPVNITCILHEWMQAWIYVLPHPYFAITDANGAFRIDNVPAGKFTLLLEHIDSNQRERRSIEVQPGRTLELNVIWDKIPPKR